MPLYNTQTIILSNPPVEVTSSSAQMAPDTTYIANHTSRVILTLPSAIEQGQQIRVRGLGDGGWRVTQNAGQSIVGAISTTVGTGGYVESQTSSDTVALECVVANTQFRVIGGQGTKTIV